MGQLAAQPAGAFRAAAPTGTASSSPPHSVSTTVPAAASADQIAGVRTTSNGEEAELTSKQEAKQLAFFLLHNVKRSRKRQHLVLADLLDFLPPNQAAEAFAFLDIDGDGTGVRCGGQRRVVWAQWQCTSGKLAAKPYASVMGL